MSKKNKKVDPIPNEFSTYKEAADFWDTHDTMDYPEIFKDMPVKAEFRRRRFQVEVDEEVIKALRKQAQKLGISVDFLANDILQQQMQNTA